MKSEIMTRLGRLEDRGRANEPSMILVASDDGFIDKGSREVFSRREAEDLEARNKAILVEFRIVYKEDR